MSATNKTQPSTRHYAIRDEWIDAQVGNPNAYVDILEIRQNPTQSKYLQWLVNQGIIPVADYVTEQQKASFVDNGLRVGDIDGGQGSIADISGWMKDEKYRDSNSYLLGINHTDVYVRIYAEHTTARNIWFLGFGSTAYDGRD